MRNRASPTEVILSVRLRFDEAARVWYVAESDIPGLRLEAIGPDELSVRVGAAIMGLTDAAMISRRRADNERNPE